MPVISFDVTAQEAQKLQEAHDARLPDRAGDTSAQKAERVGKYAKRCLFDVLRSEEVANATREVQESILADYPTQPGFEDIA